MIINGQTGNRISAEDRGLQYGDGLFETLAVLQGRPALWSRHMQRLAAGCDRLAIVPPDFDTLRQEAQQAVGDAEKGVLKIVVTRGPGGRGYRSAGSGPSTRIVAFHPWPASLDQADAGVRVRLCRTRLGRNPALAGIKHLNRLEQVLARSEWDDEDVVEGLMSNDLGHLIEATSSNVFLVDGDMLVTPLLDECGVAGVMRGLVMDVAGEMGLKLEERIIPSEDVFHADGLFITNALSGVRAVKYVDDQRFDIPEFLSDLRERVAQRRIEG